MTAVREHDYTKRYWGHDYVIISVIEKGQKLRASGWGHDITKGDYLLLQNGRDSTRYKVERIEYQSNPRDMWAADLSFAPRPTIQEARHDAR